MAPAHPALVRDQWVVLMVLTVGPWVGLALMVVGHKLCTRGSESSSIYLTTALDVRSTNPCNIGRFPVARVGAQGPKEVEEVAIVPFLRCGFTVSQSVTVAPTSNFPRKPPKQTRQR